MKFGVPAGPQGGIVSLSRDGDFNPSAPDIMLLAGYRPGEYILEAKRKSDGSLVAETKFRVTASWTHRKEGPSRWFSGRSPALQGGSAWGGGPVGIQNSDVRPVSGTWRLAILLVDTNSQRFTGDTTALKDLWLDEAVRGVASGAKTYSTAAYYREVSYGSFDVSADIFGPVSLDGDWDQYFKEDRTSEGSFYSPKGSFYQTCVTAGDNLINYNNYDSLLVVSCSVPASGDEPRKSAWPYASYGAWGPYTFEEGNKRLGVISMPHDWDGIHETLVHELGHNLGPGDQYRPSVSMPNPPPSNRNIGSWDPMHNSRPLPHFVLAHRLEFGWVRPEWVEPFNFKNLGASVDQRILLSPIERGAPPTGKRAGIEVRLADGWNYYLEYRKGWPAHIGDQSLPKDGAVLVTKYTSPPTTPPIPRPWLLRVPNDIDGDGSVLVVGNDYHETDNTDPTFPADFRAEVIRADDDEAEVRIRYGIIGKPDPSIRPWPAGPNRRWQSPDIEVRNERNAADPAWFNVPWEGHENTVIAKVCNSGDIDAPGVRVNFYVKDFTVTGAPETFLGSEVKDVAAGATVEFQLLWTPPREGHFCIVVRIPLYQTPGPVSVVEMTEFNNVAQSNYSRFISREASPASRERTLITVENPYDKPTLIVLVGSQTNPYYRTYLEHTWLYLDAGERRKVSVMFEYVGEPSFDLKDVALEEKELISLPNRASIVAHVQDPRVSPRHPIDVFNGVDAEIVHGLTTEIVTFAVDQDRLSGSVVVQRDGATVEGGKVILTVSREVDGQLREEYSVVPVTKGQFAGSLVEGWKTAQAYYVPIPGLADATMEVSNAEA